MGETRILKILVIEERADFREIFRNGLEGIGSSRLLFAPSLNVGVVALRKTPFDMLLLRGELARRNNYALIKALRADGAFDKLAVLVVHPDCGSDAVKSALDAGATSCMSASFEPANVRAAVVKALRAEGQLKPTIPNGDGPAPAPIDDEEDASRLFHAGLDLLGRRLFSRAAQLLLAAIKRKPIFPEAMNALAECFSGLGDAIKAYRFRHKAVSALALQGRIAEARKARQKLGAPPAGMSGEGDPLAVAGRQLAAQGNLDGAAQVMEAALADGTKNDALRRQAAAICLRQGKEKKAARIVQEGGMPLSVLAELQAAIREEAAGAATRPAGAAGTGSSPSQASKGASASGAAAAGGSKAAPAGAPSAPPASGVSSGCGGGGAGGAGGGGSSATAGQASGGRKAAPAKGPGGSAPSHPGVQQDEAAVDWKEKRRHPRIPLADFSMNIARYDGVFTVVDISQGGICFKAEPDQFETGQVFRFNLTDSIDARMKKVQAVVKFVHRDRVGCQFLELSTRQNLALEELIKQEKKKIIDAGGVVDDDVVDDTQIKRDPSGKIIIEVDW